MTETTSVSTEENTSAQDRMSAENRRNDIIDITLGLLREGGHDQVSIGSVAQRAGVTRTLIYKHFANRQDLINATFNRESTILHETIRDAIVEAKGFEERIRAFTNAVLGAIDSHGWMFGPQELHTYDEGFKTEQSQRDTRAVRSFAQLASEEFDLSLRDTTSAMAILLSGVHSLRIQAQILTTDSERHYLTELYVDLVVGAMSGLQKRRK